MCLFNRRLFVLRGTIAVLIVSSVHWILLCAMFLAFVMQEFSTPCYGSLFSRGLLPIVSSFIIPFVFSRTIVKHVLFSRTWTELLIKKIKFLSSGVLLTCLAKLGDFCLQFSVISDFIYTSCPVTLVPVVSRWTPVSSMCHDKWNKNKENWLAVSFISAGIFFFFLPTIASSLAVIFCYAENIDKYSLTLTQLVCKVNRGAVLAVQKEKKNAHLNFASLIIAHCDCRVYAKFGTLPTS